MDFLSFIVMVIVLITIVAIRLACINFSLFKWCMNQLKDGEPIEQDETNEQDYDSRSQRE